MTWSYPFTERNWNRFLWRSFPQKEYVTAQTLELTEIATLCSLSQIHFEGGITWQIWKATDTFLENTKGQHFCPFNITLGLFLCMFVSY